MLYIEPYAGPAPIVSLIRDARREINVSVYYLSSRKIESALSQAVRRGVRVRIMLEKYPYGMKPWQVRRERKEVSRIGAQFQWAPARFEATPGRYVYSHAKYICSGHECEIGTANYDWSAFHHNREYLDVTTNPHIVRAANEVFSADWHRRRAGSAPRQYLILSPGSQSAIVSLLSQPGTVWVESEEMGDDRATLDALARKGKDAYVILPASISAQDKQNVEWLREQGVHIRLLPVKPTYMHAKMIVDGDEGFIGSENFSESSLDKNREIGVLLRNPKELAKLRTQFQRDWNAAG